MKLYFDNMDVYTRSGNVFSELKSRTVANSHYYWTVFAHYACETDNGLVRGA